MNAVAPVSRPQLIAGARPSAIVPTTMDEVYRLSQAVVASGIVPKGMETAEKCMVAILRGLEVGMTPMQSLDKIAVVNGRPTIWGDGALALVRASGALEFIRETTHGTGDQMTATCTVKRKGDPEEVTRTFSAADAKAASLWGKPGPWQQYRSRMLQMRARAFCLRDVFPDVLGGMYLREELEGVEEEEAAVVAQSGPPPAPAIDLPDMRRATAAVIEHKPAAPVAPAPEQPASHVPRGQAQAVVADPAATASNSEEGEPRPGAEILAEAKDHLDAAQTQEDVAEIRALYADEEDHLTRSERESFEHMFEEAEKRVAWAPEANPLTMAKPVEPVEPVEAPEAAKEPAAAETPQAADAEDWAAYESRIARLAKATSDQAGAEGLRKVWKAGKDYRALMEQRKAATREQRVALTAVVQEAIKRAEAPAAEPEPSRLSAAPDITSTGSEAVRACGEELFTALYEATTRQGAFKIWSRSASKRDECGASAEVLDAWAKEYQAIRKNLPEEA